MTPKQYLEQYKALQGEMENLEAEKHMILMDLALPGGMDYSADRVQTSPSDKMPNLVIKKQQRERFIDNRMAKIYQRQNEIKDCINGLECKEYKNLLWKKYIEDKGWDTIAMEMHYWTEDSGSTYVRGAMHNRALAEIQKKLQKVTRRRAKM